MTKKITIAIDAMGGENAPEKTINGVAIFLKKNISANDFILKLYGDENKIKEKLTKFKILSKSFVYNIIYIHTIRYASYMLVRSTQLFYPHHIARSGNQQRTSTLHRSTRSQTAEKVFRLI